MTISRFKLSSPWADNAAKALAAIDDGLPDLKELRHSIAHMDERQLGKAYIDDKGGRDIPPTNNILSIGNLMNDTYQCADGKGVNRNIEISDKTLKILDQAIALIDAKIW